MERWSLFDGGVHPESLRDSGLLEEVKPFKPDEVCVVPPSVYEGLGSARLVSPNIIVLENGKA